MITVNRADDVIVSHLVHLGFKGDMGEDLSVNLTDSAVNLEYDGITYASTALLNDIVDITDKGDISGNSPTIKLSGDSQTLLSHIQLGNINNRIVRITRVFTDVQFNIINDDNFQPQLMYEGWMRQPTLTVDASTDKITLSMKTENKWVKFQASLGQQFDYEEHRRRYNGDESLRFANATISTFG